MGGDAGFPERREQLVHELRVDVGERCPACSIQSVAMTEWRQPGHRRPLGKVPSR
jgi:hypothetical protein